MAEIHTIPPAHRVCFGGSFPKPPEQSEEDGALEGIVGILWLAGFDTDRIARYLWQPESTVYNALSRVREKAFWR